jgi:hypothetical protein
LAYVVHADGAALCNSRAGNTLAKGHIQSRGNGVFVTHGKDAFELLNRLVPEHDREDVVVDQLFHAFGDAAQQFRAVENGGDLVADLVEQRERLSLLRLLHKEGRRNGIRVTEERKRNKLSGLVHGKRF